MEKTDGFCHLSTSPLSDLDLTHYAETLPSHQRAELRQQNQRAVGLWRRLKKKDVPGVILGDEVGKGKTYVALALAFATLASIPKARILVLTHNRKMARTWRDRWVNEIAQMVRQKWRKQLKGESEGSWATYLINGYDEFMDALDQSSGAPAILFASYDTLKRFHSHDERRRRLLATLSLLYRVHRVRLSRIERHRLIKEMVPQGGAIPRSPIDVDEVAAMRVLKKAFDPRTRDWVKNSRAEVENFLDEEAGRSLFIRPKLDLLVVDEAHKLEGTRRGSVVTQLLTNKFRKAVWVTATPFALTLEELRRRLRDFEHAASAPRGYRDTIDDLPLRAYRTAISERIPFPGLSALQSSLRSRMVRSTWDNRSARRIIDWTKEPTGAALLPSLALERVLADVLSTGSRTHVASVRETLCSSWAATLASLREGALAKFRNDPWLNHLHQMLVDVVELDPKLRAAVEGLVSMAKRGEKAVVFTHRMESSAVLAHALQETPYMRTLAAHHQRTAKRWRERATLVQRVLHVPTLRSAYTVAKVIAYSSDAPTTISARSVKRWWIKHKEALEAQCRSSAQPDVFTYLDSIAGKGRRLPLVARYDGGVSGGDENEPDTVGNDSKFNLPCAPLILVASRKGQEGIDLHHHCRRVVLYDLPWNPALIEQRIGRVHRIGGTSDRRHPVEVIYCYQRGGYEEVIAARVKRRCEMMHALLGAGTWLEQDREVQDLDRYRMTFPP